MNNIEELKNTHLGRSVFVIGNGPSVNKQDLSFLSDKVTIGMNANCLLEQKYGFQSNFYCVSDARFLKNEIKFKYATTDLHRDTIRVLRSDISTYDSMKLPNKTYYVPSLGKNGFSFDLRSGFYFGCTTSMLAIQLAAYIGAKKIYLIGNDLIYSDYSPRFYEEKVPQDHDRFTSVQLWNIRNAYHRLKEIGIELYNCSPTSLLSAYLPKYNFPNLEIKKEQNGLSKKQNTASDLSCLTSSF